MKPNIFHYATKELSHDGFFTWLLNWADCDNSQYDNELNICAQNFVRLLLNVNATYKIETVEAGRQWNSIDVWAVVNNEYFIVIEDKKDTTEHSDQLERYKKIAIEHYKGTEMKIVFVYLKTGNESIANYKKYEEKGFKVFTRKQVLDVLNTCKSNNSLVNDFKEVMHNLEIQTNNFVSLSDLKKWDFAAGFFLELQQKLDKGDWHYVNSPSGRFLAFFYNRNEIEEYFTLYIQIENHLEKGLKLVVKITDWESSTEYLRSLLSELAEYGERNGLSIVKPTKLKAGETSTLAVVENAFPSEDSEAIDIDKIEGILKSLEKTLDEFCEFKRFNP